MNLPAIPFSNRQILAAIGIAAATATAILVVYHYATRSSAERGA